MPDQPKIPLWQARPFEEMSLTELVQFVAEGRVLVVNHKNMIVRVKVHTVPDCSP